MRIGYVAGMVWNGRQDAALDGSKLLIVRYVNTGMSPLPSYAVCADSVGAGVGEWVITVGGSSARMTATTRKMPADQTIVGIVDQIDRTGA